MFKRLFCNHSYILDGHSTIASSVYGYDHTELKFRCSECGKVKRIKTGHPEIILDYLANRIEVPDKPGERK